MKSHQIFAASALAALLAACSGQNAPKADNATTTATATAASSPVRQAGSWQSLSYAMEFDGTNLTGDMAEMVKAGKASVGQKQASDPQCLTPELVKGDTLETRLQEAIRFGPEWKVVRSTLIDGKVDFEATMADPVQGTGTMTITGTATPTTTDLVMTTQAVQPAPGKGTVRTVMKTENTHKGACTPGQATQVG